MAAAIDARVSRVSAQRIGITLDDFERMSEDERAEFAKLRPAEHLLHERALKLRELERSGKRALPPPEEEPAPRAPMLRAPPPAERPEIVASTQAQDKVRLDELMRTGRFPVHAATLLNVYPAGAQVLADWMLDNQLGQRFGISAADLRGVSGAESDVPPADPEAAAAAAALQRKVTDEAVLLQALYEIVELAAKLDRPLLPMRFMFSLDRPMNPFWPVEIYAAAVCAGAGTEMVLLSLLANTEFLAELNTVFRNSQFAYDQTMRLVYHNGALVSPVLLEALLNPQWVHIVFGEDVTLDEPYVTSGYFTQSFAHDDLRRAHLRRGALSAGGGKLYGVYVLMSAYMSSDIDDDSLTEDADDVPMPVIGAGTTFFVRPRQALTTCFLRNIATLLAVGRSPVWPDNVDIIRMESVEPIRVESVDAIMRITLKCPHYSMSTIQPITYENVLFFFTELMNRNMVVIGADGGEDYLLRYLFRFPLLIEHLPRAGLVAYLQTFNAWRAHAAFAGAFDYPKLSKTAPRQQFIAFYRALADVFYKAPPGALPLDAILQRIETIGFAVADMLRIYQAGVNFIIYMNAHGILRSVAYAHGYVGVPLEPSADYALQMYSSLPREVVIGASRSRIRVAYGAAFVLLFRVSLKLVCNDIFSALVHRTNLGSPLLPAVLPPPGMDDAVELFVNVFVHDRAELIMLATRNNFVRMVDASLLVSAHPPLVDYELAVTQLFALLLEYRPSAKQVAKVLSAVVVELPRIEAARFWFEAANSVLQTTAAHTELVSTFRNLLSSMPRKNILAEFQTLANAIMEAP
jgi:hypothetical protein